MRILYTYFGLMQRIGGVSRYFHENIIRIEKEHDTKVCTMFLSNEYFKGYIHRIWFCPKNQWFIYLRIILEECFLWLNLKFTHYDIVHLTAERLSAFKYTKKPIVITIHDMIPEVFHTNQKIIDQRKSAIYKAHHIICVSENTKKDLLKIYPDIPEAKITVIYHGHTPSAKNYKRTIEGDYLLYVGARTKIYKNFGNMLKAITPILNDRNIRLVCTGQEFNAGEKRLIEELGITDKIENKGFVSDEELDSLYHFAKCFVYPSSYEGFGIPILEAWEHGCPACISKASCFPEIGGDAVEYFDSEDILSIRKSIDYVLSDSEYASILKGKGHERLKSFTWDKAAQEHIKVYKKILRNEDSSINNMF